MDTLTDTLTAFHCSAATFDAPTTTRDPRSDPRPGDQVWLQFLVNGDQEQPEPHHFIVTGRLVNQVDYTLEGEATTCHRNRWVTFFEPGNLTHTEWLAAPQGEAAGSGLNAAPADALPGEHIEPEERAPALMTPGEHELLLRRIGPARAAWAYYRSWLVRHRWFVEADDRGDWELLPVFAREMERKEEMRRERLGAR